jgi:pyrroloquinoline quinone (PQQ) biosynthesis protein C
MATEKIFVQIDNDKIELTGQAKADYIADRDAREEAQRLLESEAQAKKQARIDAITKLGQASGLTTEEIESILNI